VQDYITVTMLNTYITRLLDQDPHLQNFWLKGEISGLRYYQQSGHTYFSLKDHNSAVNCVMFKSKGHSLTFRPEDGMEVLARGYVSVFARQGRYQVYVDDLQIFGTGSLYIWLEKLKARLTSEGYFDTERKRKIPRVVKCVGIVTSLDGAALQDILRVIRHRNPGVDVVIAHSSVQGPEAPWELVQALQLLNNYNQLDLVIISRGGGSLEDLMAFNSEELVKAVYNSRLPVISGVGHEVDVTLCDLAADLRAATPTQAAQFAVPEYSLLNKEVSGLTSRLVRCMDRGFTSRAERLDQSMMRRIWREPGAWLIKKDEQLHTRIIRLQRAMKDKLLLEQHRLAISAGGLDQLSPLRVLQRGYVILTKNNVLIKEIDEVNLGDKLQAEMVDGQLQLTVNGKGRVERWGN